jgi:hypothetical protein
MTWSTNVSRSFLGATLACARCHDHKFDPFTMADYDDLAGIFSNIRTTSSLNMDPARVIVPLVPPAEAQRIEAERKQIADLEKDLKKLQAQASPKADLPAILKTQIDDKTRLLREPRASRPQAAVRAQGKPRPGGAGV